MSAAREKGPADFDLERFIDMFDEALTSRDERVVNALRSLMMMVILTKPESRNEGHDRNHGPLRQLFNDMHILNRRMRDMEEHIRESQEFQRARQEKYQWQELEKYKLQEMKTATFNDHLALAQIAQKINGGKI